MKTSYFKKMISVIMAFAMMMTMVLPVFADEGDPTPTPEQVHITYVAGEGGKVSIMSESPNSPDSIQGCTATANSGYEFVNWTKDGVVVSTSETYLPTDFEEATYTANFSKLAPRLNQNGSVYVAAYNIVDAKGKSISKVKPGDTVIVAVSVIDERIPAELFNVPADTYTNRVHTIMAQNAFTIPNSSNIEVKTRGEVGGALCYTVVFRNVTYLGGTPDFGFTVSYIDDNNVPMALPQQSLSLAITQAVDNVPAPNIILNSANYGKVVSAGSNFTLTTSAVNTSSALELENVSVKIVLPQGLSMAQGNSQVLIGKVGKNGTINHSFALSADSVQTETAVMPVKLIYSFEAFVNGQRQTFTSEQEISINVQQQTRFDVQKLDYQEEIYAFESGYMTVNLSNKGKSTVYNVQAEIVSDDITGAEIEFLGNMAPGTQNEIDFNFNVGDVGTGKGKVVITYEDASGTISKIEKEFSFEIVEAPVWDMPDEPMDTPEFETKPNYVPVVIGVVVVAACVGRFVYNKKKKAKRAAELEDEDEDI